MYCNTSFTSFLETSKLRDIWYCYNFCVAFIRKSLNRFHWCHSQMCHFIELSTANKDKLRWIKSATDWASISQQSNLSGVLNFALECLCQAVSSIFSSAILKWMHDIVIWNTNLSSLEKKCTSKSAFYTTGIKSSTDRCWSSLLLFFKKLYVEH